MMDVKILSNHMVSVNGIEYINYSVGMERIRELQAERDELKKLLDAYRQIVFEVKDRLSKLDGDQSDWLNQEQGT